MATTKNYGLAGIGADVQLGKGGGRLVFNTGASDFRVTTDGTTLAHLQVLDPVGATDAATKQYVDDRAAGLDPKESVTCATTADTGGTFNSSGGAGGTGQITGAPSTIDGVTLAQGDRVLVKDNTPATENGIYVVTATTTTWDRASDFDTSAEVTAGAFTFVSEGTENANTGWVLQGPDPLTLNSSNLNWSLFSTSGSLVAGTGISKNGDTLDLDFVGGGGMTNTTAIVGADQIAFADASNADTMQLRTMTNVLADLDIPNGISANGLVTRTAADTYASRSVAASAVAGDEGISVVNGDGVSGNITIGLDILGQTNLATDDIDDADEFIMYHSVAGGVEGVGNYAVTASKLKSYVNAGTSSTTISEGDSSVAVADAGSGSVTTTIDSTAVITSIAASTSFNHDVIVTTGDTLTVTDLDANRVVYTTTGGQLTSGASFTYNGTTLALTAAMDITGDLDVDNININGNTISVTDTNGNLILQPNGTGQITLANGSGEEVLEIQDTVSAVNGLAITAGATGVAPTITTGTGAEANIDIGFLTNGTGVLSVTAGSGNYEDNVTADDDIPNKKYVDDAIAAGSPSGSVDTISGTVDFTSASAQSIGTIPANATVLRVTLRVGTASDAATTVTVGDATNGAASYMAATENDPEQASTTFVSGTFVENGGTGVTANATVATAGTVGSGTCIIEYRNA